MTATREELFWGFIAFGVSALAIPWFLWGNDAVIAGLPVWIWWHVGWLALTTVVFFAFTRYAWGIGVEGGARDG